MIDKTFRTGYNIKVIHDLTYGRRCLRSYLYQIELLFLRKGKYVFEQSKREKEARKNQKIVEIKEIRMFSTIDTNDFNTKVRT